MTTLWHGRFADAPAEALWKFTVSLPFDQRLGPDDVVASKAHVRGLVRGGLLTRSEGDIFLKSTWYSRDDRTRPRASKADSQMIFPWKVVTHPQPPGFQNCVTNWAKRGMSWRVQSTDSDP